MAAGRFGLDEYTRHLIDFLAAMGPNANVIAIYQPCVAALAAVALMSQDKHPATPASLTLMAGPIDCRISPTAVSKLAVPQGRTVNGVRMRAMKTHRPAHAIAAALLALASVGAVAQTPAPLPGPVASAPGAGKPPPRLMSPAETRDSATMPGERRPDQPARPQINIPLGKSADPPAKPATRAASRTGPAGINDAVARCEAIADTTERRKCRDGLARQSGPSGQR